MYGYLKNIEFLKAQTWKALINAAKIDKVAITIITWGIFKKVHGHVYEVF